MKEAVLVYFSYFFFAKLVFFSQEEFVKNALKNKFIARLLKYEN